MGLLLTYPITCQIILSHQAFKETVTLQKEVNPIISQCLTVATIDTLATDPDTEDIVLTALGDTTKMSYRYPGRQSSLFLGSGSRVARARNTKDYRGEQTGIRRHQYTTNGPDAGTANATVGQYFVTNLAKFERSFSGTDGDPTPTASNNFGTSQVMNGSAIRNMDASITLKNLDANDPVTWDVYECAYSFWDVFIWDGVRTAKCPFNFLLTATMKEKYQSKLLLVVLSMSTTLLTSNSKDIISNSLEQ